ncbi:Barstar (barnase inhibitor) [Pilibacter termitis]|uniref:Barstar (Barnase inhibitor) n=1 Tax=Pilibacter termitis TaxID=263852 RepID=A0A1T4NIL7_9ENTE|nr:barstar family protein [Pilibacter termitis]SJZ78896.1 Barstar (barnase inhibitor) [Pilibacter termitis]
MKNQIFRISKEEKEELKNKLLKEKYFVSEIESEVLKDNTSFLTKFSKEFCFPYVVTNFNALNDYMMDLDWLNNELGYVLIINNFNKISCTSYNDTIAIAESNFSGMIRWLYYWEEEITRVTGYWNEEKQIFENGMSPRKFDIYLVD